MNFALRFLLWVGLFVIGCPLVAQAQSSEHHLIRRVVVFPLKVDQHLNESADEAWWKIRESLTDHKRFLVASRRFLQQKDVFQPRAELDPADAIILGKLLDANALVTTYLVDRVLHMKVYGGALGRILWEHKLQLQPSLPIANQLEDASEKLVFDFIASIPYQGFVFTDSIIGKTVYQEEGQQLFKVEVGSQAQVSVGDEVQVVRVTSQSLDPLFLEGAAIEVFAEGEVVYVERNTITAKLNRATAVAAIHEGSLVRLPVEMKRLRHSLALKEKWRQQISPEIFSPEMTSVDEEVKEYKPLAASLSFLANLAAFLILAF